LYFLTLKYWKSCNKFRSY